MENPLVSVVIPTYNRASILKKTIHSVLQQTYKKLEIIIVDDGSTDNTSQIVKDFNFKQIVYMRKEHAGASSARNEGIRNSKGKYISFLDSDDIWMPEKIEAQLNVFKNSRFNPGVIYCGIGYIDDDGKKIREEKLPAYKGDIFLYLLGARRNVVLGAGSTVLIKRECFEECGLFDEILPSRQDLDLLIRIAKKFTFDYVPKSLVKIRIHNERISSNMENIIKGRKLLFRKTYNDLKKHKRILAKYYYQMGVLYFQNRNEMEGKKYMIKSIKTFPLICAIKKLWKYK